MKDDFIVPLNGLAQGETKFRWSAGKEFFSSFENSEILDADLDVEAKVVKTGHKISVDCHIEGNVTVPCDRCLEDLSIPVEATARLSVMPGENTGENSSDSSEDGREVIGISEEENQLYLNQIVYDYTCLALPMQRVHVEGGCNPDTIKFLNSQDEIENVEDSDVQNPFSKLKSLLGDNE